MKKNLFFFIFILLFCLPVHAGNILSDCTYNGIPLYGKVRVVDSFEDFRVKKVTSFEDLKVKKVSSFPDSCGRWQFVTSFEDFKIKYVDSFEDFRIRYVEFFEGI